MHLLRFIAPRYQLQILTANRYQEGSGSLPGPPALAVLSHKGDMSLLHSIAPNFTKMPTAVPLSGENGLTACPVAFGSTITYR